MLIYPHRTPIILNNQIFVNYGGQTGTFTNAQIQSSYLVAEILLTSYLGTPLLPTTLTGTYPFMNKTRMVTDYGYVNQILSVNVITRDGCSTCGMTDNDGCAYIYDDTFGYVDVKRLNSTCGWAWFGVPYTNTSPYQVQIAYVAGLPTGTANLPTIEEALVLLAQIDLNEKDPGRVGQNEGVGDVGIQKFSSMDDYHEERAKSALIRTNLGSSAKAMYAKRLIDGTIKRARRVLLA